ncbi:FGGY family carbohydrate kinase, partial [Pseudomonas syringae pv. tagetis]|uniref:FGGY family carbohydrate kinase n=1 Tax=Pseudomonas syringae group genomosp. 7 TaxID=251699 RepID=UPI00377034B1
LILCIGVSVQLHCLESLDSQFELLRPANVLSDTESAPEHQRLLDNLAGAQGSLQRLGQVLSPGYTVSNLLWTKQPYPPLFE